ncbi:hypothetical protein BJ912DRAFT_237029 [Pholiota molesta]|nr:hypothetical protein BJ912DRAFT_237029 [Pholiota molesta]
MTCPAFLFSLSTAALCNPNSTVKELLSKNTLKPHFKADTQAPILLPLKPTSHEGGPCIIQERSKVLNDNAVCISAYL